MVINLTLFVNTLMGYWSVLTGYRPHLYIHGFSDAEARVDGGGRRTPVLVKLQSAPQESTNTTVAGYAFKCV